MNTIGEIIAEIVERSARSEKVDRESYLTRFPEHADSHREFFKNFDVIDAILGAPNRTRMWNGGRWAAAGDRGISGEWPTPNGRRATEDVFAAFRIVEEIHRGAQGVVYKAVQRSTDRVVALKVLHGRAAYSFESEVRLVAGLSHPNVVTVHDAGVSEGRPYYAMELIDGLPLDRFLAEHALDTRAKLRLFAKICAGVIHAHRHAVIHRDLKPSNILVEPDGEPRVLDFGLARCVRAGRSGEESLSEIEGAFVGTLAYAPPEQVAAKVDEIDTRSDVYALGVILYEMLTGRRPYSVPEDPERALDVITRAEPERPSTKCRWLDDDLDCIVQKAMAKDPSKRYQSVESLVAEIDQYLAGRPIEQKRDRVGYVVRRVASRHRRAFALSVALVFVLGVLSAKMISLLAGEKAATATTLRRFELARLTNLDTLQRYQVSVASMNRLDEIAHLPPDQVESHMTRYQAPPIEPDGVFEQLVEAMPPRLIDAVRRGEGQEYDEATQWLEEVGPQLDSLGATLESRCFRFAVRAGSLSGMGWDGIPIGKAVCPCEAFVGRAYLRRGTGDHHGAVADIRVATLLASDIGDGVLTQHVTWCYHCRSQILSFLQIALTESIEEHEEAEFYTEEALAQPAILTASASLLPTRLGIHELMNVGLVTDSVGRTEQIDLVRLDAFLNGFFERMGVLTDENVERLGELGAEDLISLTDRYITCAEAWDALTASEIQGQVSALREDLLCERQTNPLLWLFCLPGNEFLMRLRTCSRRQALRLAAFAIEYRVGHGRWPEDLADALPPDAAEEIIDPRTGRAFVYDVVDNMPRMRSVRTDDLFGRFNVYGIEWTAEGDDLVTYFPAPARCH